MKIKKTMFSTVVSDLWGIDNYESHIEVGKEYWWNWPKDSDVYKKTHQCWHKIKVTYIRSNCMFYVLSDAPEIKEMFCDLNCFLASSLIVAELDPVKDLGKTLGDIEITKLTCCFDAEHTIVKNWDNRQEIEIPDKYLEKLKIQDYLRIKIHEIE